MLQNLIIYFSPVLFFINANIFLFKLKFPINTIILFFFKIYIIFYFISLVICYCQAVYYHNYANFKTEMDKFIKDYLKIDPNNNIIELKYR